MDRKCRRASQSRLSIDFTEIRSAGRVELLSETIRGGCSNDPSGRWDLLSLLRLCLVVPLLAGMSVMTGCNDKSSEPPTKSSLSTPSSSRKLSNSSDSATAEPSANQDLDFQVRPSEALLKCGFQNGREADLFTILEIVGGGVSCFDYDLDGNLDLLFAQGGSIHADTKTVSGLESKLLRGSGDWDFEDRTQFAHLTSSKIYAHGASCADFDHDGFPDALVYGYGGIRLFRNMGDGTFDDVSETAIPEQPQWVTAAAWLDLDSEGFLDLYLAGYVQWDFDTHIVCPAPDGQPDVCSPMPFRGVQNLTLRNDVQDTFSTANFLKVDTDAKTLGVLAAEFQSGEGIGLYVANDQVTNFLFTQTQDGFREYGMISGTAVDDQGVANASMGLALLDFNNDRLFDIFVTNFEHEQMALYVNQGENFYEHASRRVGLNTPKAKGVGFGVVAADFDGDGDEDIIFNNGHVQYYPDSGPMQQTPVYLENLEGRRVAPRSPKCKFFQEPAVGRGLATADFDRDGDLDLVSTRLFGPPVLIENRCQRSMQWLSVTLVGTQSPRTPIGATIDLDTGNRVMSRQIYSGGSYLSQSEQRLHFAWREEVPSVDLLVRWPNRHQQKLTIAPCQSLTIVETAGEEPIYVAHNKPAFRSDSDDTEPRPTNGD